MLCFLEILLSLAQEVGALTNWYIKHLVPVSREPMSVLYNKINEFYQNYYVIRTPQDDCKIKGTHNMDTIQVCIRIRPLSKKELAHGHLSCWTRMENTIVNNYGSQFVFDAVYDQENDAHIYNTVEALISSVMAGFNATIIAYGQTSSGKTHTMIGTNDHKGIIPNAIDDIFSSINNVLFNIQNLVNGS